MINHVRHLLYQKSLHSLEMLFSNRLARCHVPNKIILAKQPFSRFSCFTIKSYNAIYNNSEIIAFSKNFDIQKKYSKKRKSSKHERELEDSDDESDEEIDDENVAVEMDDGSTSISRSVPSLRIDTILKAGLGMTKKKVEKEFYASRIRMNGEKVLKKSATVTEGDDVDIVQEVSSINSKFLIVNRVHIRAIGNITGTANFPLKMQVYKTLTIEDYEDAWEPSSND